MKKTCRCYLNRKDSKDYEAVRIYQLISQMKIAQSGHVTSELTQESRLRRAHTWGLKFYGCHPEILDNCVMGMVFCIGGPLEGTSHREAYVRGSEFWLTHSPVTAPR